MSVKTYRAGTLSYTKPMLAVLFFWLLWGDFCYQLMERVVPSIMPLKFQSLGASNALVGTVLGTIPNCINVGLNPAVSFMSDRCRSRWGRRIPFLAVTLLPLVVCLLALGFSDSIAAWLGTHLGSWSARLSPAALSLACITVFMVLFSVFNAFVNSVFWYLFNDVVPEQMLARFMSWFRVVSMASVSLYNLFIFRYAGTHSASIIVGAALLYLIGFGLMCVFVKEGKYPPPSAYEGGKPGVVAAIGKYARECHFSAHYWYVFLVAVCVGGVAASTTFMLYFYQSTGMDLEKIGYIEGAGSIAMAVLILGTGWLADRYHPIRVVIAGVIMQIVCVAPAMLSWLFWQPSDQMSFRWWMIMSIGLIAPAGALIGVLDPPMFMRVFPRAEYGQFCSANALWRSAAMIVGGVLAGVYFDVLTRYWGSAVAYRCLPLWQLACYVLMLFFMFKLYRSWLRHGGDAAYQPPLLSGRAAGCKEGDLVVESAQNSGEGA